MAVARHRSSSSAWWSRPPRTVVLAGMSAVAVVVALAVGLSRGGPSESPSAPSSPGAVRLGAEVGATAPPGSGVEYAALPLHGTNPVTGSGTFWGWALLDRRTGELWGSPNFDQPNRTVSMIKFWLAALYLRAHPEPTQGMLSQLTSMIRDSNNDVADSVFFGLGGINAEINPMAELCGVTGPYIRPGYWWASTWISPRDTALLGDCVADGRVAGPQWTDWLLGEMRQVRGYGDFGIRWAFPSDVRSTIAIKNGWNDLDDGLYYTNCLAITDDWVLAVETRGTAVAGRDNCVNVTKQLLAAPPAG